MNSATLFAEAANFLEAREWGQGAPYRVSGGKAQYCLVGAIRACAMGNPHLPNRRSEDAIERLEMLICERECDGDRFCKSAIGWNDTDGRTKEEVIVLLREADQIHNQQGRLNV